MVKLVRQARELDGEQISTIIGGGLINAQVCAYVGAEYWAVDAMVGVELCREIMGGGESCEPPQLDEVQGGDRRFAVRKGL